MKKKMYKVVAFILAACCMAASYAPMSAYADEAIEIYGSDEKPSFESFSIDFEGEDFDTGYFIIEGEAEAVNEPGGNALYAGSYGESTTYDNGEATIIFVDDPVVPVEGITAGGDIGYESDSFFTEGCIDQETVVVEEIETVPTLSGGINKNSFFIGEYLYYDWTLSSSANEEISVYNSSGFLVSGSGSGPCIGSNGSIYLAPEYGFNPGNYTFKVTENGVCVYCVAFSIVDHIPERYKLFFANGTDDIDVFEGENVDIFWGESKYASSYRILIRCKKLDTTEWIQVGNVTSYSIPSDYFMADYTYELQVLADNQSGTEFNCADNSLYLYICPTEDETAESVLDNVEIGFANGDSKKSVTRNLSLPTIESGYAISWSSSDSKVITKSGKVIRPDFGDCSVTLTAKINSNNNKTYSRKFKLTVKGYHSGESEVSADCEAISIGFRGSDNENCVTKDLVLCKEGPYYGSKVTWESSNPGVISDLGEVRRPGNDSNVFLTATVTYGSESLSKIFCVTVKGIGFSLDTDSSTQLDYDDMSHEGSEDNHSITTKEDKPESVDAVISATQADAEELQIQFAPGEDCNNVKSYVSLPTKGSHGSTIQWKSNHETVISGAGKVVRQDTDYHVILTARISKENCEPQTKEFDVTVIARSSWAKLFGSSTLAVAEKESNEYVSAEVNFAALSDMGSAVIHEGDKLSLNAPVKSNYPILKATVSVYLNASYSNSKTFSVSDQKYEFNLKSLKIDTDNLPPGDYIVRTYVKTAFDDTYAFTYDLPLKICEKNNKLAEICDLCLKYGEVAVNKVTETSKTVAGSISAAASWTGEQIAKIYESLLLFLSGEEEKGESEITITGVINPTSLIRGQNFSIGGIISSTKFLSSVSGTITDGKGNIIYTAMVHPGQTTSYSLKNSTIDNALLFGELSAGTYDYLIEAKADGASPQTLVKTSFVVEKPKIDLSYSLSWPIHSDSLRLTTLYDCNGDNCHSNGSDKNTNIHGAIDISTANRTEVYPVASGTVCLVHYLGKENILDQQLENLNPSFGTFRGFGNVVIVRHTDGRNVFYSQYSHLDSINVKPGDFVTSNDVIAKSGQSAYTQTDGQAHLDFSLFTQIDYYQGANAHLRLDPLDYLPLDGLTCSMDCDKAILDDAREERDYPVD